MNSISIFRAGNANEEVIGFDVTIDERLVMNGLYTGYLSGAVSTCVTSTLGDILEGWGPAGNQAILVGETS